MEILLERLGNPSFPAVHIAGTNGKGSICAMVERALRLQGYKTGLYTSPYIERYEERIRLCGIPVSEECLVAAMQVLWPEIVSLRSSGIQVTEFEAGTALAFLIFARERVDIAVIEVGLGGRLDPTNVIKPLCCGISRIGMDHMQLLGNTMEAIAGEKAGIFKRGIPVVTGAQDKEAMAVLRTRAAQMECPFDVALPDHILGEKYRTRFSYRGQFLNLQEVQVSLPGVHQAENAAVALGILERLGVLGYPVKPETIREAFDTVHWPGRLEWLGQVLLDGAHNEPGVERLFGYARAHLSPMHTILIAGMMKDKETSSMAKRLSALATRVICTTPQNPRALPAEELAEKFAPGQAAVETVPENALKKARAWAGPEDIILVCGSLYLIGDIRPLLHGEERRDV